MAIEFFWMPGGPFALRCLMTLAVKELRYQSHQLDVSKQENRTPEFLALSPKGTLPVLRDDAIVVRESQAIMFYLDRAYSQMPLYGENPADAAKVMQEICEQQSYAEPVLNPLIAAIFFKREIAKGDLAKGVGRFEQLLREIDHRLRLTGWLAGERMSAADINLYPLVQSVIEGLSGERAADFGLKSPPHADLLHLADWMAHLKSLVTADS